MIQSTVGTNTSLVLKKNRETFSENEGRLFLFVQPLENLFDEQRVLASVRFAQVDMSERSVDVISQLHEMSQCERCSVEV